MLSVRATYDGKEFILRKKLHIKKPKEVIITFLDPITDNTPENDPNTAEIHKMVQQGGALDFLNDQKEDIYSDDDLKIKY
jgi:hypothetical protein